MLYPFLTLADDTEIVHSGYRPDGTVLFVIETPIYGGFKSARFVYPKNSWKEIEGYDEEEIKTLENIIEKYRQFLNSRITVTEEENWYIATEKNTGITSKGRNSEDALSNLTETLELYFEEKCIKKNEQRR